MANPTDELFLSDNDRLASRERLDPHIAETGLSHPSDAGFGREIEAPTPNSLGAPASSRPPS
jgi:hypothetical protein